MSAPCPTCQALICSDTDDSALYNIESPFFPYVLNCPPGFSCSNSGQFKMVCCGTLFTVDFPPGADADTKNALIQEVVNQCAVQLAACGQKLGCLNPPCDPPPPTTQLFYNRDQTCTINCPDGTVFTYTVVAGTFSALTQTDADKQALDYACNQVALRRVCMTSFSRCLCANVAFSIQITSTGGLPPILYSIVGGALPAGLTMASGGLISGTPTGTGIFTFQVRAMTGDGGFVTKPFTLSVLDIATTSIPNYTVGVPYSYQMLAAGGSGNYNWSIASGALPDGLFMNNAGLITGTPTGGAGVQPITFRLIDTTCEAGVQTLQPPRITMATQSTTQIATVRGYDEFITSTPPKRYHTAVWTGTSEQKLFVNGVQIGGAKYEYSGFDHVDSAGNITDTHSKIFSAQCNFPGSQIYGQIQGNDPFGQSFQVPFKGYYGMAVQIPGFLGTPNFMCPSSSIPYQTVGDIGINGTFDKSDLWGAAIVQGTVNIGISDFVAQDSVNKTSTDTGSATPIVLPYCPKLDGSTPAFQIPSDFFTQGRIDYENNYSCSLLDEYTDAEALANARVILGNSSVAQNLARTTGFVSTFTNVVFTLLATNLVQNQNYLVSVDFWDQNTAVVTTRQYGFTADNTGKHSITDVVPTPIQGHRVQVRNPRIAFAT